MTAPRVLFVPRSGNSKLGGLPATYTSADSCPLSCPLRGSEVGADGVHKGGPCYASSGMHTRMAWARAANGDDWGTMCRKVRALPHGQYWRHDVAGDLPGDERGRISVARLRQLTAANRNRNGWSYTHHDPAIAGNLDALREANAGGFTVSLSADGLEQADAYAALGGVPVVVTVPRDFVSPAFTEAGRLVILCPAQANPKVTCASCRLCAKRDRTTIVAFKSHGNGAKKLDLMLNKKTGGLS